MKKMLTAVVVLLFATGMMAQNYFEGDIVYLTNAKYSEDMKKFTGNLLNSLDTVVVTIKGDKVHQYQTLGGIHTIYSNAASQIIVWGDYTRSGYYLPYVQLTPNIYPSLFDKSEKKTIAGKDGVLYSSRKDIMGTIQETLLFVTDMDTPIHPDAPLAYGANAFEQDKIAMRYILRSYPVGKMRERSVENGVDIWMENSMEVISIKPREVSDGEFDIPADCNMEFYDELKQSEQLKNIIVKGVVKSTVKKLNKDLKKSGQKVTEKEVEDAINLGSMIKELQDANIQRMRETGIFVEPSYTEELELKNIEEKWSY